MLRLAVLLGCLATGLVPHCSLSDFSEKDEDRDNLAELEEDGYHTHHDETFLTMKRQFSDGEDGEEQEFRLPSIPPVSCYRQPTDDPLTAISSYTTMDKSLSSGGRLVILDRLLTMKQAATLLGLFQSPHVKWLFTGLELAEIQPSDFVRENKAPWTATIPSATLVESQMWKTVRPVLETLYPGDGPLLLADATGYAFRWGDGLQPDLGNKDDDALVVQIFFDQWLRNYYGETLLYNEDGMVCAGIHPRRGRLAVFPASVRRLLHPPAIDYMSHQHIIELRVSRSSEGSYKSLKEGESAALAEIQKRSAQEKIFFTDTLGTKSLPASDKNPVDYLVTRHTLKGGDQMAVFDRYLDEGHAMKLRQFALHNLTFAYALSQAGTGNITWRSGLKVRHFVQSRLYEELQKVVDFFTGRTAYHPYDVSCNVIRSADNTHIHQDCEPGEDDVTLLIYLNPNWTRNLYGETVFYEKDEQGNYESKLAVRPRFGRIAVFNGVFPYSAQPPSPTFPGARYTLAVKYAPNRELAKAKDSATAEINALNAERAISDLMEAVREKLNNVPEKVVKTLEAWSERLAQGESIPSAEVSDLLDKVSELTTEQIRDEL